MYYRGLEAAADTPAVRLRAHSTRLSRGMGFTRCFISGYSLGMPRPRSAFC